jgi:hypothetical protein
MKDMGNVKSFVNGNMFCTLHGLFKLFMSCTGPRIWNSIIILDNWWWSSFSDLKSRYLGVIEMHVAVGICAFHIN